jgi:hypothetical protein
LYKYFYDKKKLWIIFNFVNDNRFRNN